MRRVFFSFHFQPDNWRAAQVRNSNVVGSIEKAGFQDGVDWETIKRQGEDAIKRWIKTQLEGTSVTVVLIGTQTADREWVQYEISESHMRGNGMLGIYIHNVRDQHGQTSTRGNSPFDYLVDGNKVPLSSYYKTYDWVGDSGRDNIGKWIEEAAKYKGK